MGDLVQFPQGGRRKLVAPGVSQMFCAACGKDRIVSVNAAEPGPCSCGGRIFTSDPGLGVGSNCNVTVTGIRSPIPVEIVAPVQVAFGDPKLWTFGNGS